MRRLVAVVGATATGKTALSEALAGLVEGEIVCADARQVFAELELGTGKPTRAERAARPHHLFDAWRLGQRLSAGDWARAATAASEAVFARGRTVVLVGGSGLYVDALRRGLFAEPPGDPVIRERLAAERLRDGTEALHARLARLDPETASRLEPRDRQRILRALEVLEASGRPMSWWVARPRTGTLEADWRVVEITCSTPALGERIARRTRDMFGGGLVEETRALLDRGLGPELAALRAIGYDEAIALLAGTIAREEAEARTNSRTRQLAKRQRTWFRHQIEGARYEWDGGDAVSAAGEILRRFA